MNSRRRSLLHILPPQPPLFLLLVWVALLFSAQNNRASASADTPASDEFPPSELPSSISIRAAMLHAPPFANVKQHDNGTIEYSGFQYDLLERLKIFAAEDNVDLQFQLSVAPSAYDEALNLVASDYCQGQKQEQGEEGDCEHQLDMILGNFYATPDRAMRVDLSPAWLKSTISTMKYKDKQSGSRDFTTLTQASDHNGTVCLKDGTFYAGVVREKFPRAKFHVCNSYEDCIAALKAERCVLYADDELQLHYRAAWDSALEVTPERFNTQWIVWPKRFGLSGTTTLLLDKWLYAATINATLDELYHTYFQKALCPVGTSGEHCELPCDPDHGKADATNDGQCVCISTKWTGDDCSIEVPEEINAIPTSLKVLSYVMLGINVTVITVCALWLHGCRYSAQVRYSQPFFLLLVLLGCLISSCTIIPMAQEDDGDASGNAPTSCMAIPWLYSVGFSVTFGTLFAKILRVYLIFTQAEQQKTTDNVGSSTRRYFVTFQETLCVIGVVLLIDVSILVAWTVYDPLTWEREIIRADQFGAPLESEGYCTSDHWAAFGGAIAALHLLLLGVACYMCYAARAIPTQFSESKYLSIAMISNLQIFVVGIPILIIIGADPQTSFFVRSVIIWMNDLAVVVLLFGNLMYSVYMTPPECNRDSFVRREISSAVNIFRKQKLSSSTSLRKHSSSTSMGGPPPPLIQQIMDEHSASEQPSEKGFNACAACHHQNRDHQDNNPHHLLLQEEEPPRPTLPLEKRPAMSISSLTLGSRTSSSQSRKSVSWGLAYFSECGADEEAGVPIVDTLPVDMSSPPEEANRTKRFNAHACQGAPQYKRPSASPEFQVSSTGPVLPRRKSSIRMIESTIEHLQDSHTSSYAFTPQPPINEESPESSDTTTNDMDQMPDSEQFVSALGFSDGDNLGQWQPFESSKGTTIETDDVPFQRSSFGESVGTAGERAPQKPDRRPTDATLSSVLVPEFRDSTSAPQKPDRRPTDTSLCSTLPDLRDRRLSDTTKSSSLPDLRVVSALQPPDRRMSDTSLSSTTGHDVREVWGLQKLERRISDTSITSRPDLWESPQIVEMTEDPPNTLAQAITDVSPLTVGGFLVAKARHAVEKAQGAPGRVLLAGSRHTVETAQGAPQPPGRRNSSSFVDLDDSSSSEEEEEDNDIKHRDLARGTPDLMASLYSSDEITTSDRYEAVI